MTKTTKEKHAHNNAAKWFAEHGYDMNGMVLHHIDMSLKKKNKKRYAEWRPEDLVPMTKQAHMALHMKLRNKKGTMKKKAHKKAISEGVKSHYTNFRNCAWIIWHDDVIVMGKLIPAEERVFKTSTEAAKFIGCTKQLVS